MRQLIHILLLSGYMLGLLRPLLPYLDYQIRYTYYAEVLCVNKDRPQLHCDDKCALAQKLKQAAPKPQAPLAPAGPQVEDFLSLHVDCCGALSLLRLSAFQPAHHGEGIYSPPSLTVPCPPPWCGVTA